jgi:FSR family fosmidomycin resistance protein-like MFS transporter
MPVPATAIPEQRRHSAASTAEPAFQTGRVVTISSGHAVHDTYTAFLAPLLPAFKDSLHLSNTELGLLTVFLNAPSLVQPVLGYLGDRTDLRTLVMLAPAVAGVTMSLLGVAPGYAALAMLLIVAGLNSANLHAVAPVMAGRLSGDSLGRGMGFWMVGGELGRTLGPLIVVTAVARLGLEGTPWLMPFGFLASLLVTLGLRGVPIYIPKDGDRPASWQALRSMGPFLVPLSAILAVRALMIGALTIYLPVFLSEEGATLWRAGAALSVLQAAGVVGALLGGALSDRLGRRLILALSLLLTPLFMFAFLAAEGWGQFLLLPVLGLTSLSTAPAIMALVQESFPQSRSLANGVYMALNFLIQSAAVLVLGALGDRFGLRTAFAVSAAIPLLGLPFLLLLPQRRISDSV